MVNPTSESPTHPDAPRADGETPAIDLDATLKPCPFCGGDEASGYLEVMNENEGIGNENGGEATPYYRVVCHECNGLTEGGRLESHAIAAWNRRAALPALLDRPAPSETKLDALAERAAYTIERLRAVSESVNAGHDRYIPNDADDAADLIAEMRAALLARHRDGERESDKWFVPVVSSATPPAASPEPGMEG